VAPRGRRLAALWVLVVALVVAAPAAAGAQVPPADTGVPSGQPVPAAPPPLAPPVTVAPRPRSRALGKPWRGRLADGVQLPAYGVGYMTWDGVLDRVPNRDWRRWGTTGLVALVERVCAEFQAAHASAPLVLVGDLSRPQGGVFDRRYGGLGHASHQNGLDVDVYYPRRDGLPLAAIRPGQVDRRLAQDLVDRFVAAGAEKVFVGLRVALRGPRRVVQRLAHHDDHLHVRIPTRAA
jgi:murein endopeptidase